MFCDKKQNTFFVSVSKKKNKKDHCDKKAYYKSLVTVHIFHSIRLDSIQTIISTKQIEHSK